jgi:hypothetical protein
LVIRLLLHPLPLQTLDLVLVKQLLLRPSEPQPRQQEEDCLVILLLHQQSLLLVRQLLLEPLPKQLVQLLLSSVNLLSLQQEPICLVSSLNNRQRLLRLEDSEQRLLHRHLVRHQPWEDLSLDSLLRLRLRRHLSLSVKRLLHLQLDSRVLEQQALRLLQLQQDFLLVNNQRHLLSSGLQP